MKLLLALAFALVTPQLTFSQAKSISPSNGEQGLRRLVKSWNEAEARGDHTYIASLLDDEFSFLGGADKTQYLKWAGANDGILLIDASVIEKMDVRIYGHIAIVTTLNSFRAKGGRQKYPEDKFWQMTVWVKKSGGWKCVRAAINAVESKPNAASNNGMHTTADTIVLKFL